MLIKTSQFSQRFKLFRNDELEKEEKVRICEVAVAVLDLLCNGQSPHAKAD